MSESEQTTRRPVIVTENECLMHFGTHVLTASPGRKQMSCGGGKKLPRRVENVYMFAVDNCTHVSLLSSIRRNAVSLVTGGSN